MMAVRVIVPSVPECYHVLGIIHHRWTPLQERFKDYIASPKSNGYQSLHTTIFGPGGQLFEVQIRTQEMHRTAEYGIAAHWLYKTDNSKPDELDRHFGWFRQLLELQQDTASPEEFLEFLKVDLYQDEIFVFTPAGDVKRLPKGATAIDFAFHVHTDVGLRCQGSKVNGRIAPLHRELKNGDTVEILTGPAPRPSRDWLAHVVTARARHKIKQWIKHEEETVSAQLGRDILGREVKRRRLAMPDQAALARAAPALNLTTAGALEIAIGRGDLGIAQVMKALYPELPDDELEAPKPTVFGRLVDRWRLGRGIKIQGVDGLMVRYAQCCQPVPGDAGRGVRDPGPGDLDPPGRLSQSAHPGGARPAGGDRLAGGRGRVVRGAAGAQRRGPARALRRHHGGDQPDRHQHPARRPAREGRLRLRDDLRRGGQSAPPRQGHQGHSEDQRRALDRAS